MKKVWRFGENCREVVGVVYELSFGARGLGVTVERGLGRMVKVGGPGSVRELAEESLILASFSLHQSSSHHSQCFCPALLREGGQPLENVTR